MVEFGKPPRVVLSIEVSEAYFHCGKALDALKTVVAGRAGQRAVFPSISEVIHDQTRLGEPESQAVVAARYKTQLVTRPTGCRASVRSSHNEHRWLWVPAFAGD